MNFRHGVDGLVGGAGSPGQAGVTGAHGVQGPQGPEGMHGPAGSAGYSSASGTPGAPGVAGVCVCVCVCARARACLPACLPACLSVTAESRCFCRCLGSSRCQWSTRKQRCPGRGGGQRYEWTARGAWGHGSAREQQRVLGSLDRQGEALKGRHQSLVNKSLSLSRLPACSVSRGQEFARMSRHEGEPVTPTHGLLLLRSPRAHNTHVRQRGKPAGGCGGLNPGRLYS